MQVATKDYLSKSDFLKYQCCPAYFWLWKHNRELIPEESNEEIIKQRLEQGNEVEAYARQLFSNGVLIKSYRESAEEETRELISDGVDTIFQATVITDNGLLAMADVLERDGDGWNLYEVKSTNTVDRKKHLPDAAFQKVAFETAGYQINAVFIIHMNKEYVKHGDSFDSKQLLEIDDRTDEINTLLPEIRDSIGLALERMQLDEQPKACPCRYKSNGQHCPTFSVFNPDVPAYSIYNISRMQGKKLATLVDTDSFEIKDIPDDFALSANQKKQVEVTKNDRAFVDLAGIELEFDGLEFPLYFLDYESVNPALPFMTGTHPYQQNVFQYSLHILDSPGTQARHAEYLVQDTDIESVHELVASLRENIGDSGSVIAWHKVFERDRNKELASMFNEYEEFMLGLNDRLYDLEDVFCKNLYVDPGFLGKTSIKFVLPVLVPEFSYKLLNIQKGDMASLRWYECTVGNKRNEASQTYADLKEYCCLDTLAMVKIYEYLAALR